MRGAADIALSQGAFWGWTCLLWEGQGLLRQGFLRGMTASQRCHTDFGEVEMPIRYPFIRLSVSALSGRRNSVRAACRGIDPNITFPLACKSRAAIAMHRRDQAPQAVDETSRDPDQFTLALRTCVFTDAEVINRFGSGSGRFHVKVLSLISSHGPKSPELLLTRKDSGMVTCVTTESTAAPSRGHPATPTLRRTVNLSPARTASESSSQS